MKSKIIDFLKLFVLTFAMIQGFFYTYCFILVSVGCAVVWWVTIMCYVAAFISQWFFFKWVGV